MEKCNLPSKLDLNDVSKDSIDKAYNVYLKEIGNNDRLTFKGLPVKVTKTLDYNLRQQTFEHIISRDMKARLYDPNRLNKIPWIKHILSYCNNVSSVAEPLSFFIISPPLLTVRPLILKVNAVDSIEATIS